MSNRLRRTDRAALAAHCIDAARAYSTAAVLLHAAVAERFGLSATDLKALDLLQRRGPLAAGELARETGLATASVTSLIDRLEAKRFVERRRDAADRRRVTVTLTPRVGAAIAPLFAGVNRRLHARLGRLDAAALASIEAFLAGAARDVGDEASRLSSGMGEEGTVRGLRAGSRKARARQPRA